MGFREEDEQIALEELKKRDQEKEKTNMQARINRGKLDPKDAYTYIVGSVVYNPQSTATNSDPMVIMHAFDLLALEELWEERKGVLVPKQEARLLKDEHGRILEWGTNEARGIRPYVSVQSLLSEQERVLEEAITGTLCVKYTDKPRDQLVAHVFSNSLFDAQGLEKIQLSKELRPDLETRAEEITTFYVQLKMQK